MLVASVFLRLCSTLLCIVVLRITYVNVCQEIGSRVEEGSMVGCALCERIRLCSVSKTTVVLSEPFWIKVLRQRMPTFLIKTLCCQKRQKRTPRVDTTNAQTVLRTPAR